MNQLIDFITRHPILWLALGAIVVLLVLEEVKGKGSKKQLSTDQVTQMMNKEKAVVVDVRRTEDFGGGHILGAVNVPGDQFDAQMKKLNKYKSKPVIVVCYKGISCQKFAAQLSEQGFQHVHSMQGGMNAWKEQGLPVEK